VVGITSGVDGSASVVERWRTRIVSEEIGDRDGFVAMWAVAAGAKAAAEDAAVIATLLAEETRLAVGALIDDGRLGQTCGEAECAFIRRTLA
jgi:hypothetical protein